MDSNTQLWKVTFLQVYIREKWEVFLKSDVCLKSVIFSLLPEVSVPFLINRGEDSSEEENELRKLQFVRKTNSFNVCASRSAGQTQP